MEPSDFEELAALYALDVLTKDERSQFERELAQSELTEELAEFQAAVAAIAYSAPLVPLANDLKERLMQRIVADEVRLPGGEWVEPSTIETLKQQAETVQWQPYALVPQTMLGTLLVDETAREVQCFVRAIGSVTFPRHRHAQSEEIVVLEGDLEIGGQVYRSGDRVISASGTDHQPATQNGCLLFLRTSIDDEILA